MKPGSLARRFFLGVFVVPCVAVPPAAKAQTALVAVSHDDLDGLVLPGETVRVRVLHSRSGDSILAGIGGSLLASGNLGIATNLFTQLIPSPPDPGYSNSLGSPVGGSVTGILHEFHAHPIFTFWIHPGYLALTGVEVLSFDWTAPLVGQPTTVNFDWEPSAQYPNVRAIVPPYGGFHWAFLPTTYTGASLTVLPTPASMGIAACAALLTASRRRSGR